MNLAQWQCAPVRETQPIDTRAPRSSSQLIFLVAFVAVAVTCGIGLYAVQDYERREAAARDALAAVPAPPSSTLAIVTPHEVEPVIRLRAEDLEVDLPEGKNEPAAVTLGDDALITLHEHRGSRYDTLAERVHAVQLRLRHVVESEANADDPGKFIAKPSSGNYEVVWSRPDGRTFRIMDVTKRDVRAWKKRHGKTSKAILANTIADQLNASFYVSEPQS